MLRGVRLNKSVLLPAPFWSSVLVKNTVAFPQGISQKKDWKKKKSQCVFLVFTNTKQHCFNLNPEEREVERTTSMQPQLTYESGFHQFSTLLFPPISSFPPAQAQKLASNHTVDVSLCEVRSYSSCKTPCVYRVWNFPPAVCPSEPSTGRLERLQRHRQKFSHWLLPLQLAPPRGLRSGCAAQTPVVGGAPRGPAGRREDAERTLRNFHRAVTLERWIIQDTGSTFAWLLRLFGAGGDGSRLFASHASRMEMRRKWEVTTLWENTLCGSLCSRTLKGQQRCFDYRGYSVCVGCFFCFFAFPSRKLKASLDGKTRWQRVRTEHEHDCVKNKVEETRIC